MNNDFKKGFFTGLGGLLGVLSIPVGIYIIYFLIKSLYVPTTNLLLRPTINLLLRKGEYLDYRDCLEETKTKRSTKLNKRGYLKGSERMRTVFALQREYCGDRPKEWKWQLETYYKPSK